MQFDSRSVNRAVQDLTRAPQDIANEGLNAVGSVLRQGWNSTVGEAIGTVRDGARQAGQQVKQAVENPSSVFGNDPTARPAGEPGQVTYDFSGVGGPVNTVSNSQVEKAVQVANIPNQVVRSEESVAAAPSSVQAQGAATASPNSNEFKFNPEPSRRLDSAAPRTQDQSGAEPVDVTYDFSRTAGSRSAGKVLGYDQKLVDAGILMEGVSDPANARMKAHLNSWIDQYNTRSDIPAQLSKLDLNKDFTAADLEVVKIFQADRGVDIKADGTGTGSAGPATLRALTDYGITEATEARLNAIERGTPLSREGVMLTGEKGKAVAEMQARLRTATGGDIKVDGDFGPQTLAEVRKFEQANGLTSDPSGVSKATLDALLRSEPDQAALDQYAERMKKPAAAAPAAAPAETPLEPIKVEGETSQSTPIAPDTRISSEITDAPAVSVAAAPANAATQSTAQAATQTAVEPVAQTGSAASSVSARVEPELRTTAADFRRAIHGSVVADREQLISMLDGLTPESYTRIAADYDSSKKPFTSHGSLEKDLAAVFGNDWVTSGREENAFNTQMARLSETPGTSSTAVADATPAAAPAAQPQTATGFYSAASPASTPVPSLLGTNGSASLGASNDAQLSPFAGLIPPMKPRVIMAG